MRTKLILMCLVTAMVLVGSVQAAALPEIVEGFGSPTGWDVIDENYGSPLGAQVSTDTGYSWSGYGNDGVSSWGLALYDDGTASYLANNIYDLDGANTNAWTIFDDGVSGADSVADLKSVEIVFGPSDGTPSSPIEVIIQDAAGDWFVSDITVASGSNTTVAFSAVATSWRTIATPVLGTAIVPGVAGTPDLSSVLGGGVNYLAGTGSQGAIRIDSMTFSDVEIAAMPFGTPLNGAVNVPIAQILSWTDYVDPDVTTLEGYDVYFDPNEALVTAGNASVLVSPYGTQGTATTYDPDLDPEETYFWRIDPVVDFGTDPNVLEGAVWSFTTVGLAPEIELNSVVTTSALLPTDLSATVTDASDPPDVASVQWTLLADDFDYPAGAVASVTDTTSDLYAPTATFTTDTEGTYKVKLTVNDLSGNSDEAIAQIDVFDDACTAAGSAPSWAGWNPMDLDFNCVVNVADFAIFALQWMDDITLKAQETYASVPGYLPMSNGIVNGNLETGDLTGWWPAGTVAVEMVDGSYALAITDAASGVSSYNYTNGNFYDLPVGNHSLKFRYKNDAAAQYVIGLFRGMGQDPAPTDGSGTPLVNSTTTGYETMWIIETASVASYVQYEIQFTVDTEELGDFYIANASPGSTATGYFDDFELVLNSH